MAPRGVVELHRSVWLVGFDRDPSQEVEVDPRLDLDDLGTQLGEQPARLRHRDAHPEVDDANPGERGTGSATGRRESRTRLEPVAVAGARCGPAQRGGRDGEVE